MKNHVRWKYFIEMIFKQYSDGEMHLKQVNILVFQNHALQMLYLKHHVYKTS